MTTRDQPFRCYCYDVSEADVLRAMADHGARSVEQIQILTNACCGCRTCRSELEDLLAAVAKGKVVLPKPSR